MNRAVPKIKERKAPYIKMFVRSLPSLLYQYAPTQKGSAPVSGPMIFWLRLR